MKQTQLESYDKATYWKQYQAFFPERFRITEANKPIETWWQWDDIDVHVDRFTNPAAALKIILIHGGGGYGRFLAPIGLELARQGYEVLAPDLPGYGLTQVKTENFTHHYWLECLSALVDYEKSNSSTPIVLFGLSLGGYLAYLTAAKNPVVSGIIASTLADPRHSLVQDQFIRNKLFSRLGLHLMPVFDHLLGNIRLPIKWFSKMHKIANKPDLTRLIINDPVGGANKVPIRFMRSLFDIKPDIEPQDFKACPLLLVHPAQDRWTTIAASRLLYDRLSNEKSCVMLENCGHVPIEEPGITQMQTAITTFLRDIVK